MSLLYRLWTLRHKRPEFVAIGFVTLLVLVTYPFIDWWLRSAGIASEYMYGDFGAYMGAVNRWQTGEAIYLRSEDGGFHGTFLYPPIALVLFLPFKSMNFAEAVATWNLLSLGLLWVGVLLVIDALTGDLAVLPRFSG